MKNKKQKYYIENGNKNRSLICANNIELLEPYLPENDKVQAHMIYERLACKKVKERRPKPLLIPVENTIFNALINELVREKHWKRVWEAPCIPLILQSNNLPIAIIISRDNVDYFKNLHY